MAKWRAANAAKLKKDKLDWYRFKRYGVTAAEYEHMLLTQKGHCAICGEDPPAHRDGRAKLAVDHCHKTGKVRGLLCAWCNAALGYLKEDLARVAAVTKYLRKHAS